MTFVDTKATAEVTISARSRHGEGIAFYHGKEIYILQALEGERLKVAIGAPFVPNSKRCPGTILEVITASPYRVSAQEQQQNCAYYGRCGGCQLTHVSLEGQLAYKRADIIAALSTVVPDAESLVREVVPTTQRPCRFKSIRYAAPQVKGAFSPFKLGFYAPNSHDLVPLTQCPLEPKRFAQVAKALEHTLNELGFPCYDEQGKQSCAALRAVQLRLGDNDAVSALLIMSDEVSEAVKASLKACAQKLSLESLSLGINKKPGNALFTREIECIAGMPAIPKTLLGSRFAVYPNTFLQVNYEICTKLYEQAIAHCVGAPRHQRALDLCCGVGTMTLGLAQHFDQVVGVEIVAESIAAAKANAANNGLEKKCDFIAADMTKELPRLMASAQAAPFSAIIADPARVGLGEENARLLAKVKGPCRMALIFCALPALKRDLPPLLKGGFSIDYVQGFDMFPHSQHVETLVCLSKK